MFEGLGVPSLYDLVWPQRRAPPLLGRNNGNNPSCSQKSERRYRELGMKGWSTLGAPGLPAALRERPSPGTNGGG